MPCHNCTNLILDIKNICNTKKNMYINIVQCKKEKQYISKQGKKYYRSFLRKIMYNMNIQCRNTCIHTYLMHDDRFGRNKLLCTYTHSNSKFDEILVDFKH